MKLPVGIGNLLQKEIMLKSGRYFVYDKTFATYAEAIAYI